MTAPKLILVTSAPKLAHPVMLSGDSNQRTREGVGGTQ